MKKLFLKSSTLVLESLFNSEHCEILKSTYSQKHLQTAASENLIVKLRIKNYL